MQLDYVSCCMVTNQRALLPRDAARRVQTLTWIPRLPPAFVLSRNQPSKNVIATETRPEWPVCACQRLSAPHRPVRTAESDRLVCRDACGTEWAPGSDGPQLWIGHALLRGGKLCSSTRRSDRIDGSRESL